MQIVLTAAATGGPHQGVAEKLPLRQEQTINQRKFRRLTAGSVLTSMWQPQGKAEQISFCFSAWVPEVARTPP